MAEGLDFEALWPFELGRFGFGPPTERLRERPKPGSQ